MIDYYMITTGRPAKCLKFRSQLSPVQADDSVSYHSQHLWLGANLKLCLATATQNFKWVNITIVTLSDLRVFSCHLPLHGLTLQQFII